MFWDTQVMAEAVRATEEHLGPMGRYISLSDSQYSGVGLYTQQASKFWYGDIDLPAEQDKLKKIAEALKETLYVIPELRADDSRPIHERALLEVTP